MAVGAQMPRPQPLPGVRTSARPQGYASPGRKKRSPPLTPLRGLVNRESTNAETYPVMVGSKAVSPKSGLVPNQRE
jgi:hypothetical protein